MKNFMIAIMAIAFVGQSFGQSKKEIELREEFWSNTSGPKSVTEMPDKWKNESAVILYRSQIYKYTNNGKKMYNPSSYHERVLLMDKSAIEDYAQFSYKKDEKIGAGFVNWRRENTTIGIKIIKPNGDENVIDISKEQVSQDEENIIAIPGLEVGDILDVFIYEDDYLRTVDGTNVYDPIENVLSAEYPILYRKLAVEVENDYFLNMESYNDAPEIVEEQTDRKATRRFVLEARDVEKSDFPRWFYPLNELPAFKFQVTFALKARNEASASVFLAEKDATRKTGVTKEEIIEYYGDRFDVDGKKEVKNVLKYLEEKGIKDKREQLVKSLYYIRHKSFNQFIELVLAKENGLSTYMPNPCDSDYVVVNEDRFVNYMAGLAKQLEVDYDIIVATPAYNGSIDDLLLRSNVSHGIRFNFPEPLYFFNLSPHVQPDFFPESLEGTKVYVMSVEKNRKLTEVSSAIMPVTSASDNISSETLKVNFSEGFSSMKIQRDFSYSGHFKIDMLPRWMSFDGYLNEEFKRYQTKRFYRCKKRQSKSEKEFQNKMYSMYSTQRKARKENLQELVENNFDVKVSDYKYEVANAARYSKTPALIKDEFTIEGEYVKKAGPNFIVEVGKFIGGQVEINENEKQRSHDVFLDHAKTFHYEIEIEIPDGYEVVGLDKLDYKVGNASGSFSSKAKVEDGKLKFVTDKVYNKKKYSAEEWKQMLPWLDAAHDFSQQKVMFKKI